MDHDTLFETDICTWAEQQVTALRSLASRSDLPNTLDLANVVEGIEGVGQAYINDICVLIHQFLSNTMLLAVSPDDTEARNWRERAIDCQADLAQRYQPQASGRIDMALLWRRAARARYESLDAFHLNEAAAWARSLLDIACPFSVDEVADGDFDVNAVIRTMRESFASRPEP